MPIIEKKRKYTEKELIAASVLGYFIGDFKKLLVWEELLEYNNVPFSKQNIVHSVTNLLDEKEEETICAIFDKFVEDGIVKKFCKLRGIQTYTLNNMDNRIGAFLKLFDEIYDFEVSQFQKRQRIAR